ncbi:MAG: acetyl-CoA carboxylase biotin carboxylase subunit [Candidatus Eisenbacteria sp.]|nr:acetyl-CoA carboxylase biotin carboxylase subunit [Candidatus Eisenbacteria bacterium]
MFKKILIANRGEIALRVIRACRELGVSTVAVHSEPDADSLHVRFADEYVCIGPGPAIQSYLNIPAVIAAAEITDADAIHPGYGFLAENADFAEMCESCSIEFIGPTPAATRKVGDKVEARETMLKAGIPVVPGTASNIEDEAEALAGAEELGYPVLLKSTHGGGGRGMKMARDSDELRNLLSVVRSEAGAAFGSSAVYLEKYLERPRHIEIQIMADRYGRIIYFGERECSVQRRYQKLIEEAPSPAVDDELRARLGEMAVRGARSVGYEGAGTVEFLLTRTGDVYFIEMNARIQVEHPVTECVTGLDLLKMQIQVAAGEPLGLEQQDVEIRGHAIECRINAEDPARNFAASTGTIRTFHVPGGPGVRIDTHVHPEYVVYPYYDSLLAKLIAFGQDRNEAIRRMRRCLDECVIEGVSTTVPFHRRVLRHERFVSGDIDTGFVDSMEMEKEKMVPSPAT